MALTVELFALQLKSFSEANLLVPYIVGSSSVEVNYPGFERPKKESCSLSRSCAEGPTVQGFHCFYSMRFGTQEAKNEERDFRIP